MILQWTYKPGNMDDSASETTSRHTSVYLLSISFRESFCHKSNSGAKNLWTDKQTDNSAPWREEAEGHQAQVFINVIFVLYIKSRQVSVRLDTAWIRTRNP